MYTRMIKFRNIIHVPLYIYVPIFDNNILINTYNVNVKLIKIQTVDPLIGFGMTGLTIVLG